MNDREDDIDFTEAKTAALWQASNKLQTSAGMLWMFVFSLNCRQDGDTMSSLIDAVRRAIQEWEAAVREYQARDQS